MKPPNPIIVKCDLCGSPPGERCRTEHDRERDAFHSARWKALVSLLHRDNARMRLRLTQRDTVA